MQSHIPLFVVLSTLVLAAPGTTVAQEARNETEQRYDRIVEAFIEYDIGKLTGQAGQEANEQFRSISGDQAIPAVIRGVNRAARMRQSCPIAVVSRKLRELLDATEEPYWLKYAMEQLDDSSPELRYKNYVQNLKQMAEARQRALDGKQPLSHHALVGGTPGQLRRSRILIDQWSGQDLKDAVAEDVGAQLMQALTEIEQRKGSEYTEMLARSISAVAEEEREAVRGLLATRLTRMTERTLRAKLNSPDPEVRIAAARAIGYKGALMYSELVQSLRDPNPTVAQYAHETLVKLSGEDFGPPSGAKALDWYEASKRWQRWVDQRSSR